MSTRKKSVTESSVLFAISMSDEEAEDILDALGLLCGGELFDLFHHVAGEHCANIWRENKEFETHGMKMTQAVKTVHYTMSGEGWCCSFFEHHDYNEFEISGHAMMLLHFIKIKIVDADTALEKLQQLRDKY